jgi:hypothetical protein
MEGRWHYPAVVGVLVALVLGLPGIANAAERDSDAHAETEGRGVDVVWTHERSGGASGRQRSGEATCQWKAELYLGTGPYGDSRIDKEAGEQPTPDHQLYLVWCGERSGLSWLGPANFDDAQPIAEELVRRLTVGDSAIQVRPDSRGITGIPSYFWIEGYGDEPLQGTESAFGLTVAVTIRLVGVDWDFGDDTPVVHAGLGEAWPERSSVEHNYRYSSTEPYTVTATLRFQPIYTVNDVAGAPLEAITIPVSRPYLVHQIQAERTR